MCSSKHYSKTHIFCTCLQERSHGVTALKNVFLYPHKYFKHILKTKILPRKIVFCPFQSKNLAAVLLVWHELY